MKTKTKILLAALLFAALSAYLTHQFLEGLRQEKRVRETRILFVAERKLLPGESVTKRDVAEREVPEDSYLPEGFIDKPDQIIGRHVKKPIMKGEVFMEDRLLGKDEKALAYLVPKGKRAVSVAIDEFSGVGDLLRPEDRVDVYVTAYEKTVETAGSKLYLPETSILLLQDLQVLAVSKEFMRQEGDAREETPKAYAVTLAVSPEEGERLVLGEEMGSLKLALRPFNDDSIQFTPGVVRDDLVTDKGKIVIPK